MVKQEHTDPEPQKAIGCPFGKCAGKPLKLGLLRCVNDWWVWCKTCGSSGPHGHNEGEAVELWNARQTQKSAAATSIKALSLALLSFLLGGGCR